MRKKDPKKEEAIIKAAMQEFARQGFHKTRMSQIADKAGVAAGSLYLYFKNKQGIIIHIINSTWERMYNEYEIISDRPDYSAVEKLDALIDLVFDIFTGNPEQAIIFVNEQHYFSQAGIVDFTIQEDRFIELGKKVLREGIADGIFNPYIDITIFKEFIFGGLRHLLNLWASKPEAFKLNKIRQELKLIIKKGILKQHTSG